MTRGAVCLRVDRIDVDPSIQPRTGGIDPDHVRALEESPESWGTLAVVQRAGSHVMVDGFHRLAAAQNLGREEVEVRILDDPKDGDLRALAFRLNAKHGRPLSLSDRRAEAARVLGAHAEWSDREIGRHCGLSQPTVARIREDLEASAQIERTETRVGRGGYTYTAPDRRTGELPSRGLGEALGDAVGQLVSRRGRIAQRKVARYLQRLAVALGDLWELDGWDTPEEAAEACRVVLGQEQAVELGASLGASAEHVLAVAEQLAPEGSSKA